MTRATGYSIKPRYGPMALAAAVLGAGLLAIGAFASAGPGRVFAIACGVAGIALAGLWLLSPVRKLDIAVSDSAVAVRRGGETRLAIQWHEVERVLVSDSGLYLWTGDAARSLLVTGPGIPGPYEVDRREALIADITARSPAGAIERVDDLLVAYRELMSPADEEE